VTLFGIILFLHVLGAIVAFGPTFAFPIIGGMGGKEPMHANFATRATEAVAHRMVFPLALVQGVTGVLLVATGNVDLTKALWLDVAIVLYVMALGWSYFRQTPAVARLVELTTMPAGGPPAGGPPAGGPPPGVPEAVRKVQQGGMILGLLIVAIVFLMVTKPF
jgi:uncharacterized membrane protein